jgi:hypothetical protein
MKLPAMAASTIGHSVYRFIQLILALAVVGLYAPDLNKANKQGKYSDGKWVSSSPPHLSPISITNIIFLLQVYAVVTASLSSVTALVYMIPFIFKIPFLFVWDTILFILWIALFGLFGNMYIKEDAEGNAGIKRMKNAVWVDLVNALLWLISAIGMFVVWWRHNRRSQYVYPNS